MLRLAQTCDMNLCRDDTFVVFGWEGNSLLKMIGQVNDFRPLNENVANRLVCDLHYRNPSKHHERVTCEKCENESHFRV